MVSHRRNRRTRAAGIRGLLLNYRDIVVLAICAAGLLAAWLVYGVTGSGNHGIPAAGEPAATALSGQMPGSQVRAQAPAKATAVPEVPSPDPAALPAVPLADGGTAAAQPSLQARRSLPFHTKGGAG